MPDESPNLANLLLGVGETLKRYAEGMTQLSQATCQHIQQIGKDAGLSFQKTAEEIKSGIDAAVQPIIDTLLQFPGIDPAFIKALQTRLEQFLSESGKVHRTLAERGWFLVASKEIPAADMLTLVTVLEDTERVDEFMSKWVEDRRIIIQEILMEKYPSRQAILECAFRAHDNEDYLLSIPVFLAQADGIYTIDQAGLAANVYSIRQKKGGGYESCSKSDIDALSIEEEWFWYFFEPLRMITSLNKPSVEADPAVLNRHSVLHGMRCDYGTKQNSLRAISWLLYIGTFKDEAPSK